MGLLQKAAYARIAQHNLRKPGNQVISCGTCRALPVLIAILLQDFLECTPEQMQNIVQTNLVGSLLCARGAWRVMREQPHGGHIFNIDGAGADGCATPQYAAYGATKAGAQYKLL